MVEAFTLLVTAVVIIAGLNAVNYVLRSHNVRLRREALYNGTKSTYTTGHDLPQIKMIQEQYKNSQLIVSIEFDRPFNGIIFSEGHSTDPHCTHLAPRSGLSRIVLNIDVNLCGATFSNNFYNVTYGTAASGTFIESSIKIQYDPLIEYNWDKFVTFRIDILPFLTVNYYGENLVGKGPLASKRSGLVGIGQSMTMVL
ncbi:hypothetical protein Ocin01_13476 [Orchesella cincta]|uniref:Uncharacterized protein n=1 Tax=Orchesella cincta TaxID=48709 RepID=A0A1D2MJH1_ORCCI|nr:hypothetical protein Ocin01_13476 [Orchesella cincta]